MKRWIAIVVLVAAAGAAIYYSERHATNSRVGPEAVLNAAADAQRELSHPFVQVVKLSDEEEIRIGDSLAQRYVHQGGWNEETDAPMEKYANAVGRHVAARARRKLDYKFHYIPA